MILTPKQSEAMDALSSEKFSFILYGGAIRGGKTFWGLTSLLILCRIFPGSRWCVIREDMEKIRTTTIPSFRKLEAPGELKQSPFEYHHPNGSVILFKSENFEQDKELDWMRGLEVNGILFEEMNECQQQTFYKAFERVGSWIISHGKSQPKPIIIATCNPTFGWVKNIIYDRWKNGTLPEDWKYIPAKITDNPHLPQAYIDNLKNLPQFEYMVFVEGNWDIQLKTGGEFLHAFELSKHVKRTKFDESLTLHFSMDSNVFPYIAISVFQLIKIETGWIIKQIDELPAIDPENSAARAGQKIVKYLQKIGYTQTVYLYGDRSTKSRNNIDEDKRSFFKIVVEAIKNAGYTTQDKMKSAPSVASIGDFVNAVMEGSIKGISIEIGENCKTSIGDYIETKKDKDGSILKKRITDPKTKVSYEPHGHLTDCLKDFIHQAFTNEYNHWLNRFNNAAPILGKNISHNSY